MLKVRVPATTANLGPGFDCLGLALNIYNEFEFTKIDKDVKETPLSNNLIYKSMITAFNKYNYPYDSYKVNITKCNVPISRGLGSSATCIVAGIMAANHFMNYKMNLKEIINLASEIEGHGDNTTAAILGSLVISSLNNNKILYKKINIPKNISFISIIPPLEIDTLKARDILPKNYIREDCVFNISKVALLVSSFIYNDIELLKKSFEDKLHEPYRKTFIPHFDQIAYKGKEVGAIGTFISGSGSTLIMVVEEEREIIIKEHILSFFKSLSLNWQINILKPDLVGATLEVL